jgi:hypothetical protein
LPTPSPRLYGNRSGSSTAKQAFGKPVGNGRTALKYLAPYIFRVAISNRRLLKLDATRDQVTFHYRTSDTGQTRLCTLSAEEFIHRFLQHVLPRGFVKVRYFGFFAHFNHQRLPALSQMLIQLYPENNPPGQDQQDQKPSPASPLQAFSCPICGLPMRRLHTIQPTGRCPPLWPLVPLPPLHRDAVHLRSFPGSVYPQAQ